MKPKLGTRFYFISVCFLLLAAITSNEIIIKPFPFLNVKYVSERNWDSNQQNFYKIPDEVIIPNNLMDELNKARRLETIEEKIVWATRVTREMMRNSKGEFIRQESTILASGEKYKSICSESAKIFTTLMTILGVPSRVVWMHTHTVSEIYDGKWILIDAFGNVRATNKLGTPLSLREATNQYSFTKFEKILEDDVSEPIELIDTEYFEISNNAYSDPRFLLTVSNRDLYQFDKRTYDIISIFKVIFNINSQAVGEAKQLEIDGYLVGNFGLGLLSRL